MVTKVSVLRTRPDTVLDDYAKLMDLSGYWRHISKSKETILKLNLSWSLFFPSCSTPPWQVEAVSRKLLNDNYKIFAAENRTVVTDVLKGARDNLWLDTLAKHNVKFVPLTEVDWEVYKPKAEMLALEEIFPDGLRVPKLFHKKNVVHLPTMKTHGHTTITGAVKNAFGGLITERRHHSHKRIHEVIIDLLQIQKEIHTGIYAVMDGTVCGDGLGPRTMVPKNKNFILASGDQIAIDAVAAKMMGFDPMSIDFIRLGHERGLGVGDIDQIDIVGEDTSDVNFGFSTGKSPVIFFDQLLRKGRFSFVEPLLFHTGLFNLCIMGSAVYHDRIWYPFVGRTRVKNFLDTDWGRLFMSYKK
jgi:uncharacterized protein (DUF362 family)